VNSMYHQIARNKRKSVIVITSFFIIWAAIGYVIGYIASGVSGGISGIIIAAIVALLVVLWSLTLGQATVLAVSGAQPVTQQQAPVLYDIVSTLTIGAGLPMPKIYIIQDPSPNAFATGTSPQKAAITCTTGLLAIMNREELEGVTGHEMSHIKNHDIRLLLVVSTMIGLAALLASILWRTAFWGSIGDDNGNNQFVVVLFAAAALLAVVGFIFGPLIRLALSRRRESLADVSGVELTRNPVGLLNALKKLQQNDKPFKKMNHATAAMCIDDPLQHHETWYHRLYDTHPPIADRIAELEKIAAGQTV
jgi:heat shock protein HtpX